MRCSDVLSARSDGTELLRYRSNVFVMEEEYRAQKASATTQEEAAEDDASIRGVAPADSPALASSTPHNLSIPRLVPKALMASSWTQQTKRRRDGQQRASAATTAAKSQLGINSAAQCIIAIHSYIRFRRNRITNARSKNWKIT